MAEVDGRKPDPTDVGSADAVMFCGPCGNAQASSFCNDCHEYLCSTCTRCHERLDVTKHHERHTIPIVFILGDKSRPQSLLKNAMTIHMKMLKFSAKLTALCVI